MNRFASLPALRSDTLELCRFQCRLPNLCYELSHTWYRYLFTYLLRGFTDLLRTLGAAHMRGFLRLFRHLVGLVGRAISPSTCLYMHRTTQDRKTRTSNRALSAIRTHNSSVRTIETHSPDCAATVTVLLGILHV